MNYYLHTIIVLEIFILLSLSANQKIGISGLLSLSTAVFYGIGAYTTAILETKYLFNFWVTLIISIFLCVSFSLFISYISNKVRDLYFGLATLAVQIIFFNIIYNLIPLTNGPYGINGIYSPEIFGYKIIKPIEFAALIGFFVILITLFLFWFYKTPVCRLIKATRDDQIALLNFGKNPFFYKRLSFAISSIIAAIAGSLYATYVTYIDPSSFTLDISILILSIVIIGGSGSLLGPITGSLFYVLIPEFLKYLELPESVSSNLRMIIFGITLILIVLLKPKGIFGKYNIQ